MKRLLLTEAYPVDRLRAHPLNYRQHNLAGLKRALRRGQHRTVAVRADNPAEPLAGGTLLAGHGVWYASQELKRRTIAATVVECDDAEAEEIVVEDNRTQERGADDQARLVALLERLQERGRLREVGYSDDELAAMGQVLDDAPRLEPEPEELPPPPAGGPVPGFPAVEPLRQVLLGFQVAAEYERFMQQVNELRGRYGVEATGVTPVVLRAVRSQFQIVGEGER